MTQTLEPRGGHEHATNPPAPPPAPTSFAQEQLWLLDRLIPQRQAYNVPGRFRLRGALDRELTARTLRALMERHPALRTAMIEDDGDLWQHVRPTSAVPVPLDWHDLRGLAEAERAERERELALAEAAAPFDLDRAPLWRAVLVRTAEQEHVLLLTLHHIITDGWSIQLFLDEFCQLYAALAAGLPSPLAPLAGSPAASAQRQRELLRTGGLDRERAYWRAELAGAPATMPALAGRPRPAKPSYRGAAVEFTLPTELVERTEALGRRLRASPFMVFLAAFETVLLRCTGRTDILVGTPTSGRGGPDEEKLFGFFVNSLPLRTDLSGSPSFVDAVKRIRATTLAALDHQALPFEEIVRESAGRRGISHHPVFQVLFALTLLQENAEFGALTIEPLPTARTGTAKFDLAMMLYRSASGMRGAVEFATDLFDRDRVERLVELWTALLAAVLADPELPVDSDLLPHPAPEDLAAPDEQPPTGVPAAPTTAPETADRALLATVWREVLGLHTLDPDQDFFDLGGHSLLAMRITARVGAALDLDLPMTVLFQNPTLARFCAAVDAALAEADQPAPGADEPTTTSTSEGQS
ncbi:condensation domain-containing protein [Kitasatospora viridis]|nr:condensation domain-containing protein [Kitasatospora viridis]